MYIGRIKLNSRVLLAPMQGITDIPFRLLCKKYGAALCFTEAVECRRFLEGDQKFLDLAKTLPLEGNVGIQLLGNNPQEFRDVAKQLKTKIIDLNFDCPLPNVLRLGMGAFLLDKPDLMVSIVKAVKETKKIVTAKIRLGYKKINILKNCKLLEDAGVDAITIHARKTTFSEKNFSIKADWKYIKLAKKEISIPIIGNGDVDSGFKVKKMLNIADFCMIGRAAIGNPRIFRNVLIYLKNGNEFKTNIYERLEDVMKYLFLGKKYNVQISSKLKNQFLFLLNRRINYLRGTVIN